MLGCLLIGLIGLDMKLEKIIELLKNKNEKN